MSGLLSPNPGDTQTLRVIYSVSRLNREARHLLEGGLPLLWVEGEISNLARPSSGHLYFSLKDAAAQVRCAMFRTRNNHLSFVPKDGMQVLVRTRVSLYEPRGDFQLIVEHMEEAGDGALRRAFEALKQRLFSEGLFDAAHKQPLPPFPRQLGVITSPTGAAIRDILTVLKRRFPALPVLVYPVPVQGQGAAQKIAAAIGLAAQRGECDVLILARGGGSLEDLWAFNEEVVARAIHACAIPLVTGIGHEVDFTIADFAADQRAPTPSAAAALVCPDQVELSKSVDALCRRLSTRVTGRVENSRQMVQWLNKRLSQQHPGQRLRLQAQRLDELDQRLHRVMASQLRHGGARLAELRARLHRHTPAPRLRQLQADHADLRHRLITGLRVAMRARHQHLSAVMRTLDTVSPLATLSRGYAIVLREPDQHVVKSTTDVAPGQRVQARLAKGRLLCNVIETYDDD